MSNCGGPPAEPGVYRNAIIARNGEQLKGNSRKSLIKTGVGLGFTETSAGRFSMDFALLFEVGRRDWTFCVRRAGTPKKTAEKARKDPGPPPRSRPLFDG